MGRRRSKSSAPTPAPAPVIKDELASTPIETTSPVSPNQIGQESSSRIKSESDPGKAEQENEVRPSLDGINVSRNWRRRRKAEERK